MVLSGSLVFLCIVLFASLTYYRIRNDTASRKTKFKGSMVKNYCSIDVVLFDGEHTH